MVIEKRNLQKKVEENQAKQNKLSKSVPMVKKEGGDVASIFASVKELANENKIAEEKLKTLTDQINNVVNASLAFFPIDETLNISSIERLISRGV